MRFYKTLACLSLTLSLNSEVFAGPPKAWNQSSGGDWNSPFNWSPQSVPINTDDLTFLPYSSPPTISFSSNGLCNSLSFTGSYSFSPSLSRNLNISASDGVAANLGLITFENGSKLNLVLQNSGTISLINGSPGCFFNNFGTITAGTSCDLTISGQGIFNNKEQAKVGSSNSFANLNNIYLTDTNFYNDAGILGDGIRGTIYAIDAKIVNEDSSLNQGQILGSLEMTRGTLANASDLLTLSRQTKLNSSFVTGTGSLILDSSTNQAYHEWNDTSCVQSEFTFGTQNGNRFQIDFRGTMSCGTITLSNVATLQGFATYYGHFISEDGSTIELGRGGRPSTLLFGPTPPGIENLDQTLPQASVSADFSSSFQYFITDATSSQINVLGEAALNGNNKFKIFFFGLPSGKKTYPLITTTGGLIQNNSNLSFSYFGVTEEMIKEKKLQPIQLDPSNFNILYDGKNLFLVANFPYTQIPLIYQGNAQITAEVLNTINGNCPQSTQNVFNTVVQASDNSQEQDLLELGPQFKVVQFSLEKLSFAIQKDLDVTLYGDQKDTNFFVLGGYDYLKQSKRGSYTGYDVNSFYQMIGASHAFTHVKIMAAIGASESWMKLFPFHSKTSYNTVYGTAGVSGMVKKFQLGLKSLFGYSFLETSRGISFLDEKAHSNHGAWNINTEARFSYNTLVKRTRFIPYDSFGYIYGQEAAYHEHGAEGANLKVKDEGLSLFRNSLGLLVEGNMNAPIRPFADLAWVYEFYTGNNNYKAAFIGTDVYGTFTQQTPTKNYGRAILGLEGTYKDFDWKITYMGLYGKRFMEQTASCKLGYRF